MYFLTFFGKLVLKFGLYKRGKRHWNDTWTEKANKDS